MSDECSHAAHIRKVTPSELGYYVDQIAFDLSDRMTPYNGRIPRYY